MINRRTNLLALSLLSLVTLPALAQHQKIIPPSPEAASLAKMTNYEVSLNTGVPNISIPFFEINSGPLKLPIGISYHAGGFKVNEKSTSVGLGWSLDCDLQITRTINGLDDFSMNGYAQNYQIKSGYTDPTSDAVAAFNFYNEWIGTFDMAKGNRDGAPDKFTFRLLGKSGSFYVQKSANGSSYSFVSAKNDNIRITFANWQFIITDTDGTVYTFGQTGNGSEGGAVQGKEFTGPIITNNTWCPECDITSWKCISIVTPSGADRIDFEYVAKSKIKNSFGQDFVEWHANPSPCTIDNLGGGYVTGNSSDAQLTLNTLLSLKKEYNLSSPRIIERLMNAKDRFHLPYLNGTSVVDFIINDPDPDQAPDGYSNEIAGLAISKITFRGGTVNFTGTDRLVSISLQNTKGETVKGVDFYGQYTLPVLLSDARKYNGDSFMGTLYLDSLHIGTGSGPVERYLFAYPDKASFGSHMTGSDTWGYYNQKTMDLYSRQYNHQIDIAKQEITHNYASSIMNSCFSNTTTAVFSFGSDNLNEFPDARQSKKGMLRRITYPTGGYTDFEFEPNQYTLYQTHNDPAFRETYVPRLGGGLRIKTITNYDGIRQFPVSQKYYSYGENEDGTGLINVTPSSKFKTNSTGFDVTSYTQNTIYLNAGSVFNLPCLAKNCMSSKLYEKKVTYIPASSGDLTYQNGAPIYYTQVTEYQRDLGVNTGKTVYKYYRPDELTNVGNPRTLIPGTNMPYLKFDWAMGALKSVAQFKQESGFFMPVSRKSYTYKARYANQQVRVVYAFLRNIYIPLPNTKDNSIQEYDFYNPQQQFQPGNLPPESDFVQGEYHIKIGNLLQESMTETEFHGTQTLTKTTNYFYDNTSYSQPTRIETVNSKQQTQIERLKYPYDFTSPAVYPEMVAKNIISPVVENENTVNGVFRKTKTNYSGFTFTGGITLHAPASYTSAYNTAGMETDVTINSYDKYGNITQKTGRDGIPTAYLWGYNSVYPVAEVKGMDYPATQLLVTESVLQDPLSEGDLKTQLTNLRTNASGMVTAFTYKRLVGVSSITGPEGKVNTYEYDNFGRLKLIRDYQSKILKQMEYQYIDGFSQYSSVMSVPNPPKRRNNYIYCDPLTINTDHNYVFGGTFFVTDPNNIESETEYYLEYGSGPRTPVLGSQCSSPLAHVQLKINGYFYMYKPEYLNIAFVQDEHIAVKHFYRPSIPNTDKTTYIPVGTYKVILSPNADYTNFVGYRISEGMNVTLLKSGDTFTFQPGLNYTLTAFKGL